MRDSTYFARLTPCDRFFFGQSRNSELGNRQDYFATSAVFPQQTTVLGMLRYQLLLQNGHVRRGAPRFTATQEAVDLIGAKSFPAKDYGVIKKLSPVFICRGEELFFVRNHEYPLAGTDQTSHSAAALVKAGEKSRMYSTLGIHRDEMSTAYRYPGYQAKYGFAQVLKSVRGKSYSFEEVFIKEEKAHNNKSLRGTSQERGYFKEIAYRLHRGFSFGFYVTLEPGKTAYQLKDNFVTLGGRRTRFKLELQNLSEGDSFSAQIQSLNATQSTRHLLLSDAYLQADYHTKCEAVFGEVVPFRHLETSTRKANHNYYRSANFSAYRYLLERGSLLCLRPGISFMDLALDLDLYETIGYSIAIPISAP